MKKRIMIVGMILSFCFSSSNTVMAAEIVNVQSEVNANKNATARADRIDYVYKVIDGKMYKRLYNFTKGIWLGDWILD